jgi:predicted DNA-binding mobile mystery protein A
MPLSKTIRQQYACIVDQAVQPSQSFSAPPEGWIVTMRKALGISPAHIARRLGVTRDAIYQSERNERDEVISLGQMRKVAQAMGGKLVYAIIPADGKVEDIILAQARLKARELVKRASSHMALESQSLSLQQNAENIATLAIELARDMPKDFWSE